jgi:hypothetical protein
MSLRFRKKCLLYGFLVAPAFMLAFFAYSGWLGRSNPAFVEAFCLEQPCECADWHRENVDPYQIENNVWNKKDLQGYQQCVFMTDEEDGIKAGWAWSWPGIHFDVVAYPNIMYGKNPWLPSTSVEMPVGIDKIQCLEAKFEVVQEGSSKSNLSFDLWITDSPLSNPSTISHEIMIWLSSKGFWPAGTRVGTFQIDGREVKLWKKENHNPTGENEWTILTFVYKADFTEGEINIRDYLDVLIKQGQIKPEAYLSSIQLGNEIVSGYGSASLNQFEVRVCDP